MTAKLGGIMKDLIKKLEKFRLEKQLTLQDLADNLDVHYSTVCRWFKRTFKPSKLESYNIEKLLKEHDKMLVRKLREQSMYGRIKKVPKNP